MTSKASEKKSGWWLCVSWPNSPLHIAQLRSAANDLPGPVNSCRLQLSTWGLQKYLLGAGQEIGSRKYLSFSLGVSCAITHSIFIFMVACSWGRLWGMLHCPRARSLPRP